MQQCVFPTSRKNRKGESASREQRITNYQARLRSGSCYCSVGELNRRYYLWPCGDTKFIFECWKIFHEWEKRTREVCFQEEKRNSYLQAAISCIVLFIMNIDEIPSHEISLPLLKIYFTRSLCSLQQLEKKFGPSRGHVISSISFFPLPCSIYKDNSSKGSGFP